MKKIYQELFDYCFPPDFIEKLRKQYERLRQNDLSVQDYFAKSDQLRKRLHGNDDEQHIIRLFDGIHPEIRAHLRIMQVEPGEVTLEDLKSKAIAIERALKINKKEKPTDNPHTNNRRDRDRDRDRNRSKSPDRRHDNSNRNNHSGRNNNRNGGRRNDGDRGNNGGQRRDHRDRRTSRSSNWNGGNRRDDSNKKQLTDKERDEHRAANKCFNCHEVGHMAKDCPKRNKAKPSFLRSSAAAVKPENKVRASVALLRELDELTKVKESIEVSATRIQTLPTAQAPKPGKRKAPEQQHVERNAARVKDVTRRVPPTMIIQAELEGESVRVLMDSGSQADLVSSTLVDQLKLQKVTLTKPLTLQLAVSGSRGKLQCIVNARIVYQVVDEHRDFDVANIDNYDMILGMPFLHQHSVRLSFNPNAIFIGSARSLPMEGENIIVINSVSADVLETRMDELRAMLREEASDLWKLIKDTPLPPFRDINHSIPIIDESKVYRFRPSRCPEALKSLFEIKAREYLDTGRWKFATGTNAIPMLFLPKKTKDGTVALRTVLDKREQNSNTRKLTSPLPIIEDILAVVCKYKYKTLLDGKDAYEQIRIEPKDVPRSLFHTPMGTMVSLVMQQGDCNACATYQTLVCHIFSAYIGVFMFVYLDDLIIFSNTIEEHVKHIRLVFDVLRKQKLFLSPNKMQFFASELAILGHIIDSKGIRMDPHKFDSIMNWKVPTSKDQIASFLGALCYLAPNCEGIRIPMAVLSKRSSGTEPFRWGGTEERAFRQCQDIVERFRNHHRVSIKYGKETDPIYLITDASLTGGSGFISQGEDWKTAPVAAFWSGKFDNAQRNYPVTDRELLAIVASLKKFQA
ncbi:Transposon Ty3-G Gag-Pol polyprotein [Ceratobasidium sp. AG-Ba]|nr:Transposon Ty3-G Gag-Pol polyprotein [Ceratobasidium sp. AG-Ba]